MNDRDAERWQQERDDDLNRQDVPDDDKPIIDARRIFDHDHTR